MKKLQITLIICISLILLTGCWDRTEVNDMAFVTATGFDKADENSFRISVQVPLPSAMGGSGSSGGGGGTTGGPSYVDSELGRNIRESNDHLQQRMSRKLFFGHRRILVFGEAMARGGFEKSLQLVLEQPQSRLSTYVLVTEGKAVDILTASPHLEKLSSEAMREIVKAGRAVTVKDVLNDIGLEGKDPVIPVVKTVKTKNGKSKEDKEELAVEGMGVFKGDKLSYFANKEESSGALWLLDGMENKTFTFPVRQDDELNVQIDRVNVRTDYKIINGLPSFTVKIITDADMMQNEAQLQLGDLKAYELATSSMEKQIIKEVKALFDHSMDEGIDVFGLGLHVVIKDNVLWEEKLKKHWRELLPDIEVKVEAKAEIEQVLNSGIQIRE
ncbi:Ger(x)C family spore germination protein [Bacillus suaedaesalsae]|uniref:Ger(X)C family spore germination protein n=1 Tax=Bacillus suaedaesalsae TaxID=2810349 RepID=A0ABS2DM88_9BACI|nr:Ger(x)C family spore germination protein [Bacillus suaedaesalsae]MBM6619609.1 Ger(x)C family spore germination protein [Bacillus suaedaesalsae]